MNNKKTIYKGVVYFHADYKTEKSKEKLPQSVRDAIDKKPFTQTENVNKVVETVEDVAIPIVEEKKKKQSKI